MQNPASSIQSGGQISVADTTKNFGPGATPQTVTRYYLSLNTTRGAGDVLLSGSRGVPALTVGQQSWGAMATTIPASTPDGLYYLLACADFGGSVHEVGESNNCRSSTTRIQVR
jgi:hypothetical protein